MKNQTILSSSGKLTMMLFVAILALSANSAFAQGHVVRGTVLTASDHSAMPGVNILLVGTTTGTTTDENGQFEFPKRLVEGDQLLFSFVNTNSQTYSVKGTEDEVITIRLDDTTVLVECHLVEAKPKKFSRLFAALRNK